MYLHSGLQSRACSLEETEGRNSTGGPQIGLHMRFDLHMRLGLLMAGRRQIPARLLHHLQDCWRRAHILAHLGSPRGSDPGVAGHPVQFRAAGGISPPGSAFHLERRGVRHWQREDRPEQELLGTMIPRLGNDRRKDCKYLTACSPRSSTGKLSHPIRALEASGSGLGLDPWQRLGGRSQLCRRGYAHTVTIYGRRRFRRQGTQGKEVAGNIKPGPRCPTPASRTWGNSRQRERY